jgi:hypothetical protein
VKRPTQKKTAVPPKKTPQIKIMTTAPAAGGGKK